MARRPDHDQMLADEAALGRVFSVYRERGNVGFLDSQLLKVQTDLVTGRSSANLACRTGPYPSVVVLPFTDMTAGAGPSVF